MLLIMVDIPETNQYHITTQPKSEEETDADYSTTRNNLELPPSIDAGTSVMCGDLLRCLCWCCFLTSDNTNSDRHCCPDGCCDCSCGGCGNCDCGGCGNCDCGGCDNCDCGGCGNCDCGGCDLGGCNC